MDKTFITKIREFMLAADQTVGTLNEEQSFLYKRLVEEELDELAQSKTMLEELDAICDVIVTLVGTALSLGYDIEKAMHLVTDNNLSKCTNGRLLKRSDGKVLKPDGYVPVDLTSCLPKAIKQNGAFTLL